MNTTDMTTPIYPQPPQPYTSYQPAAKAPGFATAGMILGIVSVPFCWLGIGTLAIVVCALVFSGVALRRTSHGAPGRGMAIAGLVTGIAGGVLYLLAGIASPWMLII
jgi:hypothetical protein